MLTKVNRGELFTDTEFDELLPEELREAAEFHFTPVQIALKAIEFLAVAKETRVLDVGSGPGKFCLLGAANSAATFTGIEQRQPLHQIALELKAKFAIENAHFIHANMLNVNFSEYDAFYIFNPFMEHRTPAESIDNDLSFDRQLFDVYSNYVKTALDEMRAGTRLTTYFSFGDEVPGSYQLVGGDEEAKLRFWIRE